MLCDYVVVHKRKAKVVNIRHVGVQGWKSIQSVPLLRNRRFDPGTWAWILVHYYVAHCFVKEARGWMYTSLA